MCYIPQFYSAHYLVITSAFQNVCKALKILRELSCILKLTARKRAVLGKLIFFQLVKNCPAFFMDWLISLRWVYVSELLPLTDILFIPPIDNDGGMILAGGTEVLGENPVPVPLCPPEIPHGLTWARTRYSAVRGRRLTTWAIALPAFFYGTRQFIAVFTTASRKALFCFTWIQSHVNIILPFILRFSMLSFSSFYIFIYICYAVGYWTVSLREIGRGTRCGKLLCDVDRRGGGNPA
jgi:hypothetical protein